MRLKKLKKDFPARYDLNSKINECQSRISRQNKPYWGMPAMLYLIAIDMPPPTRLDLATTSSVILRVKHLN